MLAHAIDEARFRQARSRRLRRRMEVGRHPRAGGRGRATTARCARLYTRTGDDISRRFPDLVEALRLRRRARRRTAGHARRRASRLQRPAAAAQPQDRRRQAARRISRASAPTTSWSRAARTCAPCPSPSAARGSRRFVARLAAPRIDLSPLLPFDDLGRAGRRARRSAAPAPAPMPTRSKA